MGATAKMGRFQIAHKFSRKSTAWNDKWKGQHPETPLFVALDRGFYVIELLFSTPTLLTLVYSDVYSTATQSFLVNGVYRC